MKMEKMFEFLKPDFENIDDRGELKQLYSKSCKQVNYSFSKKWTFRGNHYHKINKEIFYIISGKIEICFQRGEEKETVVVKDGDLFQIFPFTLHSFNFLENTQMIVIYDKGVVLNNNEKDIYNGK